MKTSLHLFLLFIFVATSAIAQHPLVGTWQMVSIRGIDADGQTFQLDTSSVRETKIITPTHYILIATDKEDDKFVFNRCYAGTVEFENDRYIETPLMSSLQIAENVKADFKWKVIGDRFIQSGTIVRPDGRKVVIEELVFNRVKTSIDNKNNPQSGTWELIKSKTIMDSNGQNQQPMVKGMCVISPTHWMSIRYENNKFFSATGGEIDNTGTSVQPSTTFVSIPDTKGEMVSQKVEGVLLHIKQTFISSTSKKVVVEDTYKKMK
jgi:hypothetical protein